MAIMAPKPPVRREDESFDEFIDRVNQGVSDSSGILPGIIIILVGIGLYFFLHH